jgi:hypothetical protein
MIQIIPVISAKTMSGAWQIKSPNRSTLKKTAPCVYASASSPSIYSRSPTPLPPLPSSSVSHVAALSLPLPLRHADVDTAVTPSFSPHQSPPPGGQPP